MLKCNCNELCFYYKNTSVIEIDGKKYTQTHNHFRPYEDPAQEKFREFLKNKHSSIAYWNNRWKLKHKDFYNIQIPKESLTV